MSQVLTVNLADRQEIKAVDKNEYELQIQHAEAVDLDQGKKARISLRCEVLNEPTADDVYYTIFYPNSEDTEKQRNRKLNDISDFLGKIGLDPDASQIDLDDWIGKKFTAILDKETYQGRERNVIKQITEGV